MPATTVVTPSVFYFGTPIALLSTLMPDGRTTNITPMSSAWALGDAYALGLSSSGQAIRNLTETGELVINLPDASLQPGIERIAPTTGAAVVPPHKQHTHRHEPDKWRLGGFTPRAAELVRPARIAQCPVQLEARVLSIDPFGADEHARVVQAQIVRAHVHRDLVIAGTSHIDLARWRPLYYTFRHYFAQGDHVGVDYRAEQ